MKKAFTLIEMVVAVAVLAMMISLSSMIFKVSIETYRTSGATTEIMQKLRAVTDQLNRDFAGIRKDAPILLWFERDATDPETHFDQIMFFANGDFQSTRPYSNVGPSGKYIPASIGTALSGNIARIYYGQADMVDYYNSVLVTTYEDANTLARRRHILSPDAGLDLWPDPTNSPLADDFDTALPASIVSTAELKNEFYEHDSLSLSQWKTISGSDYQSKIIPSCFGLGILGISGIRPGIDTEYPDTFHKLMCQGVSSFAIQWGYEDVNNHEIRWFPSNDPDNNITTDFNDFAPNGTRVQKTILINGENVNFYKDVFGVYFNVSDFNLWKKPEQCTTQSGSVFMKKFYLDGFVPTALKFTFRLHDAKDIIKELDAFGYERKGRTFTHIVYIGD